MPKKLVVLAGPDEGRTFPLGSDAVLLGRSRATETHLIDPHVSRVHCQVLADGASHLLVDFDSPGGTFVNGKRVSKHALQPGDIIRIGNTRLQFADDAGDSTPPPAVEESGEAIPVLQPAGAPRVPGWATQMPGQSISTYKLGSMLARGKSGYVFHARDTKRNRAVAMKVLDPSFSQNEDSVRKFVEAMKSVLPLRHANLVRVFGAGKTGPHCWVAMEYVPGENLAAIIGRIETAGSLDWRQALRVCLKLASALEYAHSKNLVHQSVTPQNILIGRTLADTKLADLMLAKATEGDPTQPISAAGVPSEELSYMPPERTYGPAAVVDGRADIYSLGATFYAMLTGHPPLRASTVKELVHKIRSEAPVTLASHQLELPAPLENILQKMLAKNPDDRYQTAKDLHKHVEVFARSRNIAMQ